MTEKQPWEIEEERRKALAEQGKMEVEFYIVADPDGDYAVRNDEDDAVADYVQDCGAETCRQTTKVILTMPLPKTPEVKAEIQENDGKLSLEIKQS